MGCCEDKSDCYCGCGTKKSRILWFLVLAFFLVSTVFQVGQNVEYNNCKVCDLDGSDCQSLFTFQITYGSSIEPEQFCTDDECKIAGAEDKKIEGCSITLIQILRWLSSIFFILLWVPCCVMCCCSRKPDHMLKQPVPQAPFTTPPQYTVGQPAPATMQPYPSQPSQSYPPASGPGSVYSDSAPATKPVAAYEPPV